VTGIIFKSIIDFYAAKLYPCCIAQLPSPKTIFFPKYVWSCAGACQCYLIFLYVSDELRYDIIHPHYSNTYRIGATWSNSDGRSFDNTESPGFWVKYLRDNRTEVEQAGAYCLHWLSNVIEL
jgi:hypothetical protein